MKDYGEPWGLKKFSGDLMLLIDRNNNIIPFELEQKRRVIECINFAADADLEDLPPEGWKEILRKQAATEIAYDELKYAYEHLLEEHVNLVKDLIALREEVMKRGLDSIFKTLKERNQE